MYKIASMGLLGLIAILVIPVGTQSMTNDGFNLYGQATMTYNDANGNEMLSQTVHNQLFDEGEDFLIDNAFTGLTDVADNIDIGSICLSAATEQTDETTTNTTFNTDHDSADDASASAEKNCKTDGTVTKSAQVATIGPLTFTATASTGNWYPGDQIKAIGICDAESTDADIRGCTTTLFALVNTSDVTLADGETVDITYTFDLSSNGS
ncbi:hypothetical protein [Nitrosopumilus sp.]|uniref:hypothetical protein n=1 Tax=Nitrosopumilus sp. TaxID=2024843 RepID=UPI003D1269F4